MTVKSVQGGNFMGLLFLVFLTLKLTHVIDWSWWFVTMPLWGALAVVLIILTGISVVAGCMLSSAAVIDWLRKRRRERRLLVENENNARADEVKAHGNPWEKT
jgi:hypothetical protein